ncbi:MAG: cob(I)yrinic acid a,c-diamide adenosyltransferase [Chloroflexota bacterium]|nr:cob(I)yrinic acid a,c-diamide adenosyltransferase [Chloroflexota bacterium]
MSQETDQDESIDEEAEEAEEIAELERVETEGPLPGESRNDFAARLHAAQVARHLKRKEERSKRINKGLVILNTGNGKGKTTAALGLLLRAWGRGMRICMLQFIKSKTGNWGENRASKILNLEIIPMGDGFTWTSEDLEKDKAMAQECWKLCQAKILSHDYDIVILDEITYVISYGWLSVEEIIETLQQRPTGMHIILTGRNAVPELVEYADLVTEMREIKHPYKEGIRAQQGIEF